MSDDNSLFYLKKYKDFDSSFNISEKTIGDLHSLLNKKISDETELKNEDNQVDFNESVLSFYVLNQLQKDVGLILDEKEKKDYLKTMDFMNDFSKNLFFYFISVTYKEMLSSHLFENEDSIKYFCKIDKINKNDRKSSPYYKTYLKEKDIYKNYGSWAEVNINITDLEYKKYKQGFAKKIANLIRKENPSIPESAATFFANKSLYFKDRISSMDYSSALKEMQSLDFLKDFSDMKISDFINCVKVVIKDEKNFYKSFGGKLWENITDHLYKWANGEINTTLFIDQAISLEHNSGTLFDKDIVFKNPNENRIKCIFKLPNENYERISLSFKNTILTLQNSGNLIPLLNAPIEEMLEKKNFKLIAEFVDESDILRNKNGNLNDFNKGAFLLRVKQNLESLLAIKNNLNSMLEKNEIEVKLDNKKFNLTNFFNSIPSLYGHNQDFDAYLSNKVETKAEANKIIKECSLFADLFSKWDLIKEKRADLELIYSEGTRKKKLLNELSGKASSLIELSDIGVNVPKFLIIPSKSTRNYYLKKEQFLENLKNKKSDILSFLNDDLVSVRSGAKVSMPGMMETILNVGIDADNYNSLIERHGKETIDENKKIFIKQFVKLIFDEDVDLTENIEDNLTAFKNVLKKHRWSFDREAMFPLNRWQQLAISIQAVITSWNSPKANHWRQFQSIDENMGTDCIIQKMVYGNKNQNSFSAVCFSSNCENGKKELTGEYIKKTQGENIVGGLQTPKSIDELKIENISMYKDIEDVLKFLERKHKRIQDVELTVEDGNLFFLQRRNAPQSLQSKLETYKKFKDINIFNREDLDVGNKVIDNMKSNYLGGSVGNGAVEGVIVKSQEDFMKEKKKNKNQKLIFFARQTLPSHIDLLLKCDGFLTEHGGSTSHLAILARTLKKPCVVGIGNADFETGKRVTIDGDSGKVWTSNYPKIKTQNNVLDGVLSQLEKDLNVITNKTKSLSESNVFWLNLDHEKNSYDNKKLKVEEFKKFLDINKLGLTKNNNCGIILNKEKNKL